MKIQITLIFKDGNNKGFFNVQINFIGPKGSQIISFGNCLFMRGAVIKDFSEDDLGYFLRSRYHTTEDKNGKK